MKCNPLTPVNALQEQLLSFYNGSYGGKYELAGRIENIEKLVQKGFVTVSRCKDDPLSTHGAKTCRIPLARMTEIGISEAQEIVEDKLVQTGVNLNSLESLPSRIRDLYKFLLKQWLRSCENRMDFDWRMVKNWSARSSSFMLPDEISDIVSGLTDDLVDKDLAAYASLHHNTSGPSSPTLVTCPEIGRWMLDGTGWLYDESARARGVKTAVLDEYLKYLLNGMSLFRAKDHLLFLFNANHNKIMNHVFRWLSNDYGVPMEALLDWLEELEGCGYISKLNRNALNVEHKREMYSSEENVLAVGDPWRSFSNPYEDSSRVEEEVKRNIENWFSSGEEKFTRFRFRTIR